MVGKLVTLTSLLLLVGGGCRACSNGCDYLPPVAGSSQEWCGERAGSRFVQPAYADENDFPQLGNGPEESPLADVLGSGDLEETVSPLLGLDEDS